MLAKLMCLTVGHSFVREFKDNGMRCQCLRCGERTAGWSFGEPTATVPGTQTYWDEVYREFMDTELSLHGGG